MSRDYTSDEWIDAIMRPRRLEVEELERYLRYVQETARAEGRAEARKRGTPGTTKGSTGGSSG